MGDGKMTQQITRRKIMRRYFITVTDDFGSKPEKLLVTEKELGSIKKSNPNLTIKVDYELIGKFSYEK